MMTGSGKSLARLGGFNLFEAIGQTRPKSAIPIFWPFFSTRTRPMVSVQNSSPGSSSRS